MTNFQNAITEYLRREKQANATMRGADHNALLAKVADEYGLALADLRKEVLDSTFARAN